MSFALAPSHFYSRRGLTLTELLVAITVATLIISGTALMFVQLLRSNDQAQARIDAVANARSAIESLSVELKRAQTTSTIAMFTGDTQSTASIFSGDYVDQDGDGVLDEEPLNGLDDDNDWQLADDRHARLTTYGVTYVERPRFYQQADLGDAHVDIDLALTSSTVTFTTFDVAGEPVDRKVRYYVGQDPDGEPNTLMKEVSGIDPATSAPVSYIAPVAYNVLSFGLLFWDFQNASQPWRTDWPPPTTPLPAVAPASVYMYISVYAGTPLSLDEVQPGERIPNVILTSVVNVESTLASGPFIASREVTHNPVP